MVLAKNLFSEKTNPLYNTGPPVSFPVLAGSLTLLSFSRAFLPFVCERRRRRRRRLLFSLPVEGLV